MGIRFIKFLLLQQVVILYLFAFCPDASAEEREKNGDILIAGESYIFGHYEQDDDLDNGSEPIEWLVLDSTEEKALIISKYGLDMKLYNEVPYAEPWGRVMWENSSIRTWLNNEFYKEAFSEKERKLIVKTIVTNGYTKYSHIDGGNDTEDYIFLLSIDQAEQYFNKDRDRICFVTPYGKTQEAWAEYDGACWWWLRSPGEPIEYASHVFVDGDIHVYGNHISAVGGTVRPALWIKLNDD